MARHVCRWKGLLLPCLAGILSAVLAFFGSGSPGAAAGEAGPSGLPHAGKGLFTGDPHRVPVVGDQDRDFLGDGEESTLGTDPGDADQNRNLITDGPDWALHYHLVLEALPSFPPENRGLAGIFRVEHEMDGMETCLACGQAVNRGYALVVNAPAGTSLQVPYLALHTLAHGGLIYRGSLQEGRLPVGELARVLRDIHALLLPGDTDGDFLIDGEEEGLRLDAQQADQNGNWEPDGMDLARLLGATVEGLPFGPLSGQVYRVDNYAYGLETCAACGAQVNMGFLQVVNPLSGLSIDLPYISLHAMSCGAFHFDGAVHAGRVEMVHLRDVLALPGPES